MLTEALIEIVDEADHVEDRARILGTGKVALATNSSARFQLTSDDLADVDAIIAVRDGAVTIEARKDQALRVNGQFLPMAKPRDVQRGLVAWIATIRRHLHVRTIVIPNASLMSPTGALIREETSELERWSSEVKGWLQVARPLP